MMFEMDGQLLSIASVEHIKLARALRIDSTEATYSYSDGTHHYFMDTKTYDQVPVDEDMIESVLPMLKEGSSVFLQRYRDRLIGVELPINVDLKVVSTDPGFKGDTVSGATKPARLETGATIQVPLFIQSGDVIRVDTRDQSYIERA